MQLSQGTYTASLLVRAGAGKSLATLSKQLHWDNFADDAFTSAVYIQCSFAMILSRVILYHIGWHNTSVRLYVVCKLLFQNKCEGQLQQYKCFICAGLIPFAYIRY